VNKIEMLNEDDMRALINMDRIIRASSAGAVTRSPVLRGTAQNPDVFFQMRERANSYYDACPANRAIGDEQVCRNGGPLLSPVSITWALRTPIA
jgi:pyruvate/2-oxoacid:ferredoxin oxidoreductase alpha subunit